MGMKDWSDGIIRITLHLPYEIFKIFRIMSFHQDFQMFKVIPNFELQLVLENRVKIIKRKIKIENLFV